MFHKFQLYNLCQYFQFFVFGVLTRKYYSRVQELLSGKVVITLALIVYVISLYFCYHPEYSKRVPHLLWWLLRLEVVRISGLIVVFTFFFRNAAFFDRDSRLVSVMTYVGRRTLDIYLIHYFLLPDMSYLSKYFAVGNTFTIEFFVTLAVAILVVALCLAISAIIRLSPFLGHYLLGAPKQKGN